MRLKREIKKIRTRKKEDHRTVLSFSNIYIYIWKDEGARAWDRGWEKELTQKLWVDSRGFEWVSWFFFFNRCNWVKSNPWLFLEIRRWQMKLKITGAWWVWDRGWWGREMRFEGGEKWKLKWKYSSNMIMWGNNQLIKYFLSYLFFINKTLYIYFYYLFFLVFSLEAFKINVQRKKTKYMSFSVEVLNKMQHFDFRWNPN